MVRRIRREQAQRIKGAQEQHKDEKPALEPAEAMKQARRLLLAQHGSFVGARNNMRCVIDLADGEATPEAARALCVLEALEELERSKKPLL